MAIDVFELYEELCGSVNTQQGGHVRPDRNFIQWANAISISLFEEKFSSWAKSQKIVDDLSRPFLKTVNQVVSPVGSSHGVALFPVDYGHFSAARYYRLGSGSDASAVPLTGLPLYDSCGQPIDGNVQNCPASIDPGVWEVLQLQKKQDGQTDPASAQALQEITIDLIGNARWGAVLEHRFNKPTMAVPKMTQFEGGFKVAPAGVTLIVLDYLRVPSTATFEYTVAPPDPLTGRGDYLVYDKAKSVPLDWSPLVRNEFLTRLDKKYGKYIREDFIWQVSEADRRTSS